MRKIPILLILLFIKPIVFGQTYQAVHLADSVLKAGNFKAAVTTYDFTGETKDLQEKTLRNLKSNPQWADKYIAVLIQKGMVDIPKLLDAYGLTENEFDKMINGFKARKKALFSDTTNFTVKRNNGLITFQSSKKLAFFNNLTIDTKKNIIFFDNFHVTRERPITGKYYAPILKGIETSNSERTSFLTNKTGITYFAFTIGVNANDDRPTLCLIYGKGKVGDTEILNITIM